MDAIRPSPEFTALAGALRGAGAPSPAEVAFALARELDPATPEAPARAALAELGDAARERIARAGPGLAPVEALIALLHGEAGFRGNESQYGDPRNSDLRQVLARRTGIPITLAIVYMQVGADAGLPLEGISFPGHFLCRTAGAPDAIVDAFHGRILDDADCAALLQRATGRALPFDRRQLQAATSREIAVRMLGNLKHAHLASGELERALRCCTLLLALAPEQASEWRDRGLIHEQLECFAAAASDLERALELAPGGAGAARIAERLAALRPRAQLH